MKKSRSILQTISVFLICSGLTTVLIAEESRFPGTSQELREVITSRLGYPSAVVTILDPENLPRYSIGEADAPIFIIHYYDLTCNSCKVLHDNALRRLKSRFLESGRVRIFSGVFPSSGANPEAQPAARAVLGAGLQGKYWEMKDELFRNHLRLSDSTYLRAAERVGLSLSGFRQSLDAEAARILEEEIAKGRRNRVPGSPTTFIGRQAADGKIVAIILTGPAPYSDFYVLMESLLNEV